MVLIPEGKGKTIGMTKAQLTQWRVKTNWSTIFGLGIDGLSAIGNVDSGATGSGPEIMFHSLVVNPSKGRQ
jgi:hypothetical protein